MSLDMQIAFVVGGVLITSLMLLTPRFYDFLSNDKKSIIYNSNGVALK